MCYADKISYLLDIFKKKFPEKGDNLFFSTAPGRVNLIGEHTDYHEGFVFPASINLRCYALGRKNKEGVLRVYSVNYDEVFLKSFSELKPSGNQVWHDYVSGPCEILKLEGLNAGGMDAVIFGDIPPGGGLSSSAAVEVTTLYLFSTLWEANLDKLSLAKFSKKAENEFVGVPCGIMDQLCAVFGEKNFALLIDCRSLMVRKVPFPDDWSIIVCDTGIKHSLGKTEYRKRQDECRRGLMIIREVYPEVKTLRDVTQEQLNDVKERLDDLTYRRIKFVIEENARVHLTEDALMKKDKEKISELFYLSHEGLRNLYEVSCYELDILVEGARLTEGIIGARMTGGGFGGNTVNIVEKGYEEEFKRRMKKFYMEKTGRELSVRILETDNGVYGKWL